VSAVIAVTVPTDVIAEELPASDCGIADACLAVAAAVVEGKMAAPDCANAITCASGGIAATAPAKANGDELAVSDCDLAATCAPAAAADEVAGNE